MNDSKKTISLIMGIVGAVFSIVAIPMYFLPLLTLSFEGESESLKFTDIFEALGNLSDYSGDIMEFVDDIADVKSMFILAVVAIIAAMLFNLLTAVFSAIPGKGIKIGGVVTGFIATVIPAVFAIAEIAKIKNLLGEWYTMAVGFGLKIRPGIGLILAIVFSLLATIMAVVSMIMAPKKAAVAAGYDQYADPYADPYAADPYAQQAYMPPVQPAVPAGQGSITFLSGSNAGYNIPLNPGQPVFIGKDPAQCSIVIDKKYDRVSRRHCSVEFDPVANAYKITDYSTNGIKRADGTKLPRNATTYVDRGETIRLASTENAFRLD